MDTLDRLLTGEAFFLPVPLLQALEGLAVAGLVVLSWTQKRFRERLQHKTQIALADWLAR